MSISSKKDNLDYRYSSRGAVSYEKLNLSNSIKEFCKSISQEEQNRFVGIDLIFSNEEYFCLESNPGPGWSTFNHKSKKEFAQTVFKELSKGTN